MMKKVTLLDATEKWEPGGCLTELCEEDVSLIRPWGIEMSDERGFFSLEDGGHRTRIIRKDVVIEKDEMSFSIDVEFPHGTWRIEAVEEICNGEVVRKHSFTALDESHLLDCVTRYVFRRSCGSRARIDGTTYQFRGTNIYRQASVERAVVGCGAPRCEVEVLNGQWPDGLRQVMYIRDYTPSGWIVHVRLLPKEWEKEVLKICRDWYGSAPLPEGVTEMIYKIPGARKWLRYCGERRIENFILSGYPISKIPKGAEIRIVSRAIIANRRPE